MKKQIKMYIEAELRDYHQTKREYEELRDNLLNLSPSPPDGMPRGSEVSNPTLQKVSNLLLDRRIQRLETVMVGIEKVLSQLDKEKMRLIELKYWQKPRQLTNSGIALDLYVDRRTINRWDNAICYAIALELGEITQLSSKCPN